jgi:branched-chain amino acid transport system ATP-binding protein
MDQEILLQLKDIHVRYGGVKALDGVDISLDEGEFVALMGPNGAGKSTVLKSIFGLASIAQGEILWHQHAITPVPHQLVKQGIAYVPQGRRVFTHLSVEENLEIGAYIVRDKNLVKQRMAEVMEFFPALKTKRKAKSGTLSGGQQQMLAIARGLMVDPKVLLLDEPSLGLAPKIVKEVFAKIHEINQNRKTAVMVVEHNIKSLLNIVDRAYVLARGKVAAQGKPQDLVQGDTLEKIFLGEA